MMGVYRPFVYLSTLKMEQIRIERYFAGTRLNWKTDRLGSRDGNGFFPYGEERGTPTTNDTYKFATYWRDSTTGLDYADQRYYASQSGRFLTPDPLQTGSRATNPSTWNRYACVEGDPANRHDPQGLYSICIGIVVIDATISGCSVFDEPEILRPLIRHEAPERPPLGTQNRRAHQIEDCINGGSELLSTACVQLLAAAAILAAPREDKEDDCASPVTAISIDAYLSAKGSPLRGMGHAFVGFGRDFDVDPRFIVALAGAETTFGKNITWGSHNAWNWGWNRVNPSNSPFLNWEHGIATVTSGIDRVYLDRGKTNTASIYIGGYCVGADCTTGLANLDSVLGEQGGNSNNLRFPCLK
jgi:RHS repeat-associated protein